MLEESFESLYRRLEATVARLEEGGLSLEEGLALYEEGVQLARRLQEMLAEVELRITRLGGEAALREEAPLWGEGWPVAPPTSPATGHARTEEEELD